MWTIIIKHIEIKSQYDFYSLKINLKESNNGQIISLDYLSNDCFCDCGGYLYL